MMKFRNYSQSAENNRPYILAELEKLFDHPGVVLEIGSGSGQHAVNFAASMDHLTWQPTDRGEYLSGLTPNIQELAGTNVLKPLELDVADEVWPVSEMDYVYSANTLHIMSADHGKELIKGVGRTLKNGGMLALYGPFKYGGEFTTESNENFDLWLKNRDPLSGIRDFESVQQLAIEANMTFLTDIPMPANNQLLVFKKI
jgi:SAM-dependent methyltransferase